MKNLEFFKNLSIGQYIDSGSKIHAFSASTKYLMLACLALPALVAPTFFGTLLSGFAALFIASASGVRPLFLIRGIKPALPLFFVAAFLQFLFGWQGDESPVFFKLGPIAATAREAWIALMVVARTASMILVLGLFTALTTEGEAARGIEEAFAPLSKIGVKAHRLSLSVVMALRFVPIVTGELEALAKAQASRGADFGSGKGGPLKKARAYLPLFVPVTIRALERAELLAEAMEARCYSGEGRTRYVRPRPSFGEIVFRLASIAFCAALLAVDVLIIRAWIRPW